MFRVSDEKRFRGKSSPGSFNCQKGMYAGYIAALRRDARITLYEMSKIAGCSPAEYSAYEHERKEFDPEVYRKCEEYLKTDRRSKWERPEVVGER